MKPINRPVLYLNLVLFFVVFINDIRATQKHENIISSSENSIYLQHWQIAKDPSLNDSLCHIPDSLWQFLDQSFLNDNYTEGNWLLRTNIIIKETASKEIILGIFPVNFITAYEIFWDGQKIGQNGTIGNGQDNEKPGRFDYNIALPNNLVNPGKHNLTIRLSNYNNFSQWKWFYGDIRIAPYNTTLKEIFSSNYFAIFIVGILIIPFFFNLFLYFSRKRRPENLLFSLICLNWIIDYTANQVSFLIDMPTTYIHWLIYIYQATTIIYSLLFPVFFIYIFSLSKKYILVITVLNLSIFIFYTKYWDMFDIMAVTILVESSIISLWAVLKRCEESIIILCGIVIAWIAYFYNFGISGLATTMVLATSFSIARKFARKEKAEYEARIKSARLENELLKKNINPHFLLNTLTSIIVWLRKDPKSAIKLMETLADEFRMIIQISALKEIPIKQEIELCINHLKIMSYRKGADYKLETLGIVNEEMVPPMIFHTLVENGLSHGYENKIKGTFTLVRQKETNRIQYILLNDGEFENNDSKKSSGFGLKYIKSRLEESYPGRWELISNKIENGWETKIEIKER